MKSQVIIGVLLALVLIVGAGNLAATFISSRQRQADHSETLQALSKQQRLAARVCVALLSISAIPAPGPYEQKVHTALTGLGESLDCHD